MLKFDHRTLPVADWRWSRDWYVPHLGMRLEFEVPEGRTAALQDEHDFTIFVQQTNDARRVVPLYLEDADGEAMHRMLADTGVRCTHPPQAAF